jgi:hypothetical protein
MINPLTELTFDTEFGCPAFCPTPRPLSYRGSNGLGASFGLAESLLSDIPAPARILAIMWVDPELLSLATTNPAREVEVVVVIDPSGPGTSTGASRQELIKARRISFDESAAPVKRAIKAAGGKVIDEAWLSSSVKAAIPARALRTLGQISGVRSLGLPEHLVREAVDGVEFSSPVAEIQ